MWTGGLVTTGPRLGSAILAAMVTAARHADDWNASDYAANSRGQEAWGRALIAQLRVQPIDTILDIGCGDGRLTALLATAAPDGRVVGIDLSPDMIRLARERFGNQPNLMFETGDAATLPFDGGFTKVFSNATLHWVPDHAAVLDGIGRALEPGGRCLLQMAGAGNALEVMRALEACGDDVRWTELLAEPSPWAFLDDFTYRRLIDASGLRALDVRLFPRDMHHESRDAFRGWLRTT